MPVETVIEVQVPPQSYELLSGNSPKSSHEVYEISAETEDTYVRFYPSHVPE